MGPHNDTLEFRELPNSNCSSHMTPEGLSARRGSRTLVFFGLERFQGVLKVLLIWQLMFSILE